MDTAEDWQSHEEDEVRGQISHRGHENLFPCCLLSTGRRRRVNYFPKGVCQVTAVLRANQMAWLKLSGQRSGSQEISERAHVSAASQCTVRTPDRCIIDSLNGVIADVSEQVGLAC